MWQSRNTLGYSFGVLSAASASMLDSDEDAVINREKQTMFARPETKKKSSGLKRMLKNKKRI